MKMRQVGRSGLYVSEIALGSWLTYGADVDDTQAFACLDTALAAGINHIDTADVYNQGGAERVIGRYLRNIKRSEVTLASKCFFPYDAHPLSSGLSSRHIHTSIHRSLEHLQTDYLDLYICHRYDTRTPLEETVYALVQLVNRGLIRYWGVSQWSAVQLINAVRLCERHGWPKPVSNQPIYNLLNRSLEVDVLGTCEAEGIGLMVYSPLAQGILSGKYTPGHIPADARAQQHYGKNFFAYKRLNERTFDILEKLKPLAARLNTTLPVLALAWTLRYPAISATIIGASKPEQVSENCKATELTLDESVLQELEQILQNAPVDQYTGNRIGYGVPPTF
jgi:aryl-alcohol dehydrogenase-like predicted oxidoreductase